MSTSRKYDIGDKIGMLTIKGDAGKTEVGTRKWSCHCKCGGYIVKTSTQLSNCKTQSCGCKKIRAGKETQKPFPKYEDIEGEWWRLRIKSAKKRNYSWKITQQDVWEQFLKQDRKCYFSNESIDFKKHNVSIDRLNNKLGYEKENIVLVNPHVNFMKQALTVDEFRFWCDKISNHFKEKDLC